jgi:hypothetical protein
MARHTTPAPLTRLCRAACLPAIVALFLIFGGCSGSEIRSDDPAVQRYVELVMPRKIEIQRYLTKPASVPGSQKAGVMEVILASRDSQGDLTKSAGVFLFELFEQRMASGDRLGRRVDFWRIEVQSEADMQRFWDRLTRFHYFRLEVESGDLPPGSYVLTAQLETPGGVKLFDEYPFKHPAQ